MEEKNFLETVHEKLIRITDNSPAPTVQLKGWWWKKHFKYYRNLQKQMNDLLKYDWKNGGQQKHYEKMKEVIMNLDMAVKKTIDNNVAESLKESWWTPTPEKYSLDKPPRIRWFPALWLLSLITAVILVIINLI